MVDSDEPHGASFEQSRINDNLAVVRCYLKDHFPLYTITEKSVPSRYHQFVVTLSFLSEDPNDKLGTRYRLQVDWRRLADERNTPEHTRSALESGDVASGMIQSGDNDYYW